MNSPNALIILGTLPIAIGEIIATAGWNARTDIFRRQGLIESVAAESFVNIKVVRSQSYAEEDPETGLSVRSCTAVSILS